MSEEERLRFEIVDDDDNEPELPEISDRRPRRIDISTDDLDENFAAFDFNERSLDEPEIDPTLLPPEPLPTVAELRKRLAGLDVSDLTEAQVMVFIVTERRLPTSEIEGMITDAREHERDLVTEALSSELITHQELVQMRAELYRMTPTTLSEQTVEDPIVHILTPQQAAEWKMMPFSRDRTGVLQVALANPGDLESRSNIQKFLKDEEINFVLVPTDDLNRAIEQYYDPEGQAKVAEILDQTRSGEEEEDEDIAVEDLGDDPTPRLVHSIISQAYEAGASDIHIQPRVKSTRIRFRIDGDLQDYGEITKKQTPRVTSRVKTMAGMRTDEKFKPQDGKIPLTINRQKELDLRVVTQPVSPSGENITMRLLDPSSALKSLEDLNMDGGNLARYDEAIRLPNGCCFITGPTGSGKSTTLYSSMNRVITPEKNLISIEDPVEYRLEGISQIDIAAGGSHGITFASALRATLRADPDIIMVGEIRDNETAKIAFEAALTGHFLYSTLHTNSALASVTRLNKLGIPSYMIAEATRVIVAQRLVKKLCTCKTQIADPDRELSARGYDHLTSQGAEIFKKSPTGCERCRGRGYKGRIGVHEVVVITEELQEMILDDASVMDLNKKARSLGMGSLTDDAIHKALIGETSLEEADSVSV